eukprot:1050199-Prymnesium_polylepis.1
MSTPINETAVPLPPVEHEASEHEAQPQADADVEPAADEAEVEATEPAASEEPEQEPEEQPEEQPAEQPAVQEPLVLYTKNLAGEPASVKVYIDAEQRDRHSGVQLGLTAGRAPLTPSIVAEEKVSRDWDELRDIVNSAAQTRLLTDNFGEDIPSAKLFVLKPNESLFTATVPPKT